MYRTRQSRSSRPGNASTDTGLAGRSQMLCYTITYVEPDAWMRQSMDAVREQRRRASTGRQNGKTARSKINVRPDAKEEDQCQIPSR